MRRVRGEKACTFFQLPARVSERECMATLDTGAEQSMVRAELVDKSEYVKENVRVEGFVGEAKIIPLANVWIDIGNFRFQQKVAVFKCCPDLLLGANVRTCILDALLGFERSTRTLKVSVVGQQLVLSEQQAKQAMAKVQVKQNLVNLVGAVQKSECEESEGEEENSILIPSHIFEQPVVIGSNQVNIVDKPSGPELGEIKTEAVVYGRQSVRGLCT